MILKVAQFRYYGQNNPNQNNFPAVSHLNQELKYDFSLYPNIQRILIHTLPGTNIYINLLNNATPWNNGAPFIVGQSGVLDIAVNNNLTDDDDNNKIQTNSLKCSNLQLDNISKEIIDNLEDGYFIITIIYYDNEDKEE